MTYKVVLIHSDEGYSISCPELPGCVTEGATAEEAMQNMREVIPEYLAVVAQMKQQPERLEVEFRELLVA